jgi:hypothetical protein
MSSSSEDPDTRTKSKHWTINLDALSKHKIKLETELRNRSSAIDLIKTYCKQKTQFETTDPLTPGHEDGAHPLLKVLFRQSARQDATIVSTLGNYTFSDTGTRLQAQADGSENSRHIEYDDRVKSDSIPSPEALTYYPVAAWKEFMRYYIAQDSTDIIDEDGFMQLKKRTKKWQRANHFIWTTILNRLHDKDVHICDGMEICNGVQLYATILDRHENMHAECLAELLTILTTLNILDPDPNTGKKETIQNYFDRAKRIARDTTQFPAMNVPIADPVLKIFILRGLKKSDKVKYGREVQDAYGNDLSDSISTLQRKMRAAEGMMQKRMQAEYAPD